MSHYHIPPSCASPLTASVNNGSILESSLWRGPVQWCGFPTRGRGGGDGGGCRSGNSSAWVGSTLGGPLCQPHLPFNLTAKARFCSKTWHILSTYFPVRLKEIWLYCTCLHSAVSDPLKDVKNLCFLRIGREPHRELKARSVWAGDGNYKAALNFASM